MFVHFSWSRAKEIFPSSYSSSHWRFILFLNLTQICHSEWVSGCFLVTCSTHKVPCASSPHLEIPSSITIPPLLQGQATGSAGKLVDWGASKMVLINSNNFIELLWGLINDCQVPPVKYYLECAKCFLSSAAGIFSCLWVKRGPNHVCEETPFPIYPCTSADSLSQPLGSSMWWQRAGSAPGMEPQQEESCSYHTVIRVWWTTLIITQFKIMGFRAKAKGFVSNR